MPYLLDTNILSELRKGKQCDPNVLKWAKATTSDRHYISVLSLGEIRKGIWDNYRVINALFGYFLDAFYLFSLPK